MLQPRPVRLCTFVIAALVWVVLAPRVTSAQRANSPFPGGENPDGSLRPTGRNQRLFSQEAYTEYALLEPGSDQFRIRFFTEEARVGSTELVNATRGGSEGTDVEVYDPRTGKPLTFTYTADGDNHAIHAQLTAPVPVGGIGRVLIYKTYKDSRTYVTYTDANAPFNVQPGDISWTRSLSGYRLGVILPKGYSLLSSSIAAQMSTTSDGRLALHFANPSGLSNPFVIHARKTTATFTPTSYTDMFFDDVKTLYDLDDPSTHSMKVEQTYTDFRKGDKLTVSLMSYAPLTNFSIIDLDTAKPLTTSGQGSGTTVKLDVPIESDKQSAHLRVNGTLQDAGYTVVKGELHFNRRMKGLRNTILLPAGWEISAMSQSGTVGVYQGRAFLALVNLNAENEYTVAITAKPQN